MELLISSSDKQILNNDKDVDQAVFQPGID